MKRSNYFQWCVWIVPSLVFLFLLKQIVTETHTTTLTQSLHIQTGNPEEGAKVSRFSNVPELPSKPVDVSRVISTVFQNGWSYCPVQCLKMHASLVAKTSHLKGINIECGVADGGTAMVAAAVKPKARQLHLYDTFTGMPKPMASEWEDIQRSYRNTQLGLSHSPNNKLGGGAVKDGYNNTLQTVLKTRFFGLGIDVESNSVYFHPGLFQDTLNDTMTSDVAFAHLDGDWYDSTMTALTYIMPRMLSGGYVVVDDYFSHSGCRRAVNDYFGLSLPADISKDHGLASIRKFNSLTPIQQFVEKFGKKWKIARREGKLVLEVV